MRSSKALPPEVSLTALAASLLTRRWLRETGMASGRTQSQTPHSLLGPKGRVISHSQVRCGERYQLSYLR